MSEALAIGMSAVRSGADGADQSLRQARDAATIARALTPAGGALTYDGLGAYRYLVHLALDETPHDRLCEAIERLMQYDERRGTQLLPDARAVPRRPARRDHARPASSSSTRTPCASASTGSRS